MQEVWKDIVGYEESYQVSNLGNVKALRRKFTPNGATRFTEEKLANLYINRHGYVKVQISKNSKQKQVSVHRLVAIAFLPNNENKPEVNHIDGNKLNNKIDNLEWSTRSENVIHGIKNNLIQVKKRGLHNMSKVVINIENGIFYDCIIDASESINIDYNKLRNRLNGKVFNNTSLRYA
jgi:hypothetical protein